jgi:multiple sugar transport system ATP-binding protein
MNLFKGSLTLQGGQVVFRNEHLTLDVSAYPFAQTAIDGQACVLGVRPEDIDIGNRDGASNTATGTVT